MKLWKDLKERKGWLRDVTPYPLSLIHIFGWAGGITECRKIGAMAQAMSKPISLHCFGSAVLFAASLHLAAALPNTEMMESEENPNPLKTDIMRCV